MIKSVACSVSAVFLLFISNAVAQTNPSAQEIRTKVGELYRAPQRYFLSAIATVESPAAPALAKPMRLVIAAELPDKLRMEGDMAVALGLKGFTLVILDGQTAWLYDSSNRFYKVPRVSEKGTAAGTGSAQVDLGHPEQIVSYFDQYLFIRYRNTPKPVGTITLARTEQLSIKGKEIPCYVLQIDRGDFDAKKPGSGRDFWWVDTSRYIIWKEERSVWIREGTLEHQVTAYDTVLLDEPLPKDVFVFDPPKGSKQMDLPKEK